MTNFKVGQKILWFDKTIFTFGEIIFKVTSVFSEDEYELEEYVIKWEDDLVPRTWNFSEIINSRSLHLL